jgi:hypothetical protein
MYRYYVIPDSLNLDLHPATAIPGDGELNNSIVATEFGFAFKLS